MFFVLVIRRRHEWRCGRQILGELDNRNYRRDKAIPATMQCLHKTRLRGGILENFTNLVDRGSQAAIEVDESIRRPKLLTNLFPCDKFAGTLQEHHQQLEGLRLEPKSCTIFSKLAGMQVRFKRAKREPTRCGNGAGHRLTATREIIREYETDQKISNLRPI